MESVYENPATPKQSILQEHQTTSVVERIEFDDGIKMYIQGAQFPQKSCPHPEAMVATNILKRFSIEFIQSGCIPLSKHKFIKFFNRVNWGIISPFILKEKYMTKFSREIRKVVYKFLLSWGIDNEMSNQASKIISHIFEYDNAYRYRFQDVIGEIKNINDLTKGKELRRLATILYDRDDMLNRGDNDRRVGKQFLKASKLASIALLLPSIRKALKETLKEVNLGNLRMDDGDRYWSGFRTDYNFGGLSYNDRMLDYQKKGFKLPVS